jgi:hypothetical protein
MGRFTFGLYGRGFPLGYPSMLKHMIRRNNRVVTSFDGLRQMDIELGKNLKPLRTPHGLKVVARRRRTRGRQSAIS